jgi:transcriptional regulator with XRE-family HTH domain
MAVMTEVDVRKLKELRMNQGYSARGLSRKAGLTDSTVWMVENRRSASPETLKKIADVLGVKVTDLLKES